jgi:hypothetical protein
MPTAFGESADYELAYDLDVKEENSQRALGEARLDFLTLAADAVMIGKEIAADAHKCTIEVVRLLHGSGLQAGEQKAFAYRERIRDAEKAVRFRREPMLYLLRAETS